MATYYRALSRYICKRHPAMEASAIMRKLKELDALEKRLRLTVNPSKILLDQINAERHALLNPKEQAK